MIPGNFQYHAPSDLKQALALLKEYGEESKILAGGHSLLPMMKLRFAQPAHLIDINLIKDLKGIRERQTARPGHRHNLHEAGFKRSPWHGANTPRRARLTLANLAISWRTKLMIPGNFQYHAPSDLKQALALLKEYGEESKILAGGHSLLPMMKLRFAQPAHLIDINLIKDLKGIREKKGEIHIGAMVTENAGYH